MWADFPKTPDPFPIEKSSWIFEKLLIDFSAFQPTQIISTENQSNKQHTQKEQHNENGVWLVYWIEQKDWEKGWDPK